MRKTKFLTIFFSLFILLAIAIIGLGLTNKTISSSQEVISIPLSEISSEASWYEYESEKTKIKYFAVRAPDGSIKTAFDACDVCYKSRRGYSQDGDFMICNNCGNRYHINGLGTENLAGGGCWPGYLENNIKDDNIMIKASDLKEGGFRFS